MTRSAPVPLALVLTVLLTAIWAYAAWEQLSQFGLPDTDDMARLAQIRDWLNGQAFGDLTQYRLGGPDGVAMHWSRLPDLVPGALILLLAPLIGEPRAELAAIVAWPELLFFLHLLLAAGIARRLDAPAAVAVLLAAFAFPAIALFVPGRIDHHGLQLVLVESALLALLGRRLMLAGAASATSLLVGMETAPVLVALMAGLGIDWVRARQPLLGFGIGWLGVTIVGALLLRPRIWASAGWCDSFTPGLFALMLVAGGAWLLLAGFGPRLPDWRWRIGAGAAVAMLALACGVAAAPDCIGHPFAAIDPLLKQVWLSQIGELRGAFRQSPSIAISYLGLAVTGLVVTIVQARHMPDRLWIYPFAVIAVSVVTALFQIRGAYFGAGVAAPVLAGFVARARASSPLKGAIAGFVSVGILWQGIGIMVGELVARRAPPATAAVSGGGCADPRVIEQLERLPQGTIAAPIDMGAYLIGLTNHKVLAAPYHRNNRGNRAMYDFFLTPIDEARYQAGLWTIDYVVMCPDNFGEVPAGLVKRNSLLATLRRGETPDWLEPVLLVGSRANAWRVLPLAGRSR